MSAVATRMEAARAELGALRRQADFDARWFDVSAFTGRHGLSNEELAGIWKDTRPRAPADRFKWLEAVNPRHDLGVRALRIALAMFSFVGDHGFLWPSQRALGRRAGYEDDAEVRRGLAALVAIGAVRKVKVTNLPRELAEEALAAKQEGGSGRSRRGTAYALVPPAEWARQAQTGTPCPSSNRDTMSLLNHQDEPPPATPDSFTFGEEGHMIPVLPGRTVQILDEEKIQEGSSEPRAREAAHG